MGNDTIISSGGNDTFVYASGDGSDFIDDTSNASDEIDVLRLTDLNTSDVLFSQSGRDLLIENLTTNMVIRVDDQFHSGSIYLGLEEIHFADGTVWNRAQISASVLPILLDLDGDGLELLTLAESRATFDQNGDGLRDRTSWFGADDGLLALDRDGNGQIEGFDEISFLRDLPGAKSDLEGLAGFDSNADGLLSADDDAFNAFQIWQDRDGDGISQQSELSTLQDMEIESISLDRTILDEPNLAGEETRLVGQSTFTFADGTQGLVGDALFEYQGELAHIDEPSLRNQRPGIGLSAEDKQLQRLTQAMAMFGGQSSATFEPGQASQEVGRRELFYSEQGSGVFQRSSAV